MNMDASFSLGVFFMMMYFSLLCQCTKENSIVSLAAANPLYTSVQNSSLFITAANNIQKKTPHDTSLNGCTSEYQNSQLSFSDCYSTLSASCLRSFSTAAPVSRSHITYFILKTEDPGHLHVTGWPQHSVHSTVLLPLISTTSLQYQK